MPPNIAKPIYFGPFLVNSQVYIFPATSLHRSDLPQEEIASLVHHGELYTNTPCPSVLAAAILQPTPPRWEARKKVFHTTPHSFILTNLRPLLPGHTLVCPLRKCPRLSDLTPPEITDLFMTVQRVQKTLGRVYKATAFNVAVQDGKDAGQTVPHVHVHVIPRQAKDMDGRGGNDKLYEMLEGDEGNIAKDLKERQEAKPTFKSDSERTDRTKEEMEKEAAWLAAEMAKDDLVD